MGYFRFKTEIVFTKKLKLFIFNHESINFINNLFTYE